MLVVLAFQDEVEFVARGGGEFCVEPIQIDVLGDRAIPFQPGGRQPDRGEVGLNQPFDVGTLDLDNDFRSRAGRVGRAKKPSGMHLRQRCRGHRHGREPGENLIDWPAELSGDHRFDVL